MSTNGNALRWLWLAVAVIALDQATKAWVVATFELFEVLPVLPVFDLTRLHNPGAAFSFLATASGWQRWFFIALATGISVGIVAWLRQLPARGQSVLACGLALVMGGAIGNVIDRVLHGYVIDFIHLHWNDAYFPAFNVADSGITIGAGLLIVDALFEGRRRHAAP
ncbi:MAG: lipoprotein signal peptidase [Gammaproteobacteria bacterium]|nr:lipoprotein signal peptidase [Gammaproteobacteria bacterium]